uniref:Thioredoxin-like_fold domain-containing protein n=1 Tax=Syphacia muris TaxID=451379 RepID=A0A0N5AYS9_9BILA
MNFKGTEIIDSAKLPAQEMTSGSEEWIADFENINTHNMDKYNTLTNNKVLLIFFGVTFPVWLAVSIVEEALALKFQWSSSAVYHHFLNSLNIDPKSVELHFFHIYGSNAPKLENVPFDSLAVPPVKFDWKNSGLTNPLSSGCLFLGGFAILSFHYRSLFEQIMKSEPVEHHYLSRNELSLDARALHDQLPDLDYMLSNVLLFSVTDR